MPAIDRFSDVVNDPMDGNGVHLHNKPLLGLIIAGSGTFDVEVSIDAGATWYAMNPALQVAAGSAVSSDTLAPLAAYVGKECRVRFASYTGATAVNWLCVG